MRELAVQQRFLTEDEISDARAMVGWQFWAVPLVFGFASLGMGIGALVLAHFVHTLPGAAGALVFIGGMGGLFIVPLNAILQHRPKPDEKGRVIATANIVNTEIGRAHV